MMNQPTFLFEPNEPKPKGYVSERCRFVGDGEQRMVLVDERQFYIYDQRDKVMTRMVWVHVYEGGYATQRQISEATGIPMRTLQERIKRFRKEGAQAFVDRARSGAPRKVTDNVRKRIHRMRDAGATLREIARTCQLSTGTVQTVLREREAQAAAAQPDFLGEKTDESVSAESSADEEPEAEAPAAAVEQPPAATPSAQGHRVAQEDSGMTEAREHEEAQDRSVDRVLARQGLLHDATPLFAEGETVQWAGVFLALALLSRDAYLQVGQRIFRTFGAAFYGVRTVLVTLITMALLRVKRPEHLRRDNPQKLGRVLGLDRAPEAKTLRRKVRELSQRGHGGQFMTELAQARAAEYAGPARVVFIDGHVQIYSGRRKIGQVFSARRGRVVRGRTEQWVNLPGGQALMSIPSPFNEGLTQALPSAIEAAQLATGHDSLTAVFDRGGYCAALFEQLLGEGHHLITYRRGSFEPIPLERLTKRPTVIGGKHYDYAPFEQEVDLAVYKTVGPGKRNRNKRRNTGRVVRLREIRIQRRDGGQTAILTDRRDWPAEDVAATLFSRWGNQENFFKYMIEEYDLDSLWEYGDEEIDESVTHPNPDYRTLEKQREALRAQRQKLLAKLGETLEQADEEQIRKRLRRWKQTDQTRRLAELTEAIAALDQRMAETPARNPVAQDGYKQLPRQSKVLLNSIKMHAYDVETRLFEMLEPYYANKTKDGRKLVVAALSTPGRLRLEPNKILIRLEPQSSPHRTRAINRLAEEINQLRAIYPGSRRVIQFEPTPVEPPTKAAQAPPPASGKKPQ